MFNVSSSSIEALIAMTRTGEDDAEETEDVQEERASA
jgi:hypothetical protein